MTISVYFQDLGWGQNTGHHAPKRRGARHAAAWPNDGSLGSDSSDLPVYPASYEVNDADILADDLDLMNSVHVEVGHRDYFDQGFFDHGHPPKCWREDTHFFCERVSQPALVFHSRGSEKSSWISDLFALSTPPHCGELTKFPMWYGGAQ